MAILMGNAELNFPISVWSSAHNSSGTKPSKFSCSASPHHRPQIIYNEIILINPSDLFLRTKINMDFLSF